MSNVMTDQPSTPTPQATGSAPNVNLPEPDEVARMQQETIEAIAAGRNLTQEQIKFLMLKTDGNWHSRGLAGSQTTPRGVRCNFWMKNGKERLYFNERIFSKTPRDGQAGYIDCLTGQIVADRGYNQTLAEVVTLCLDRTNLLTSWGEPVNS